MPVLQKSKQKKNNPARTIVTSFLLVIIVGALLLTLPISSRSGEFSSLSMTLFTATSATCVTGLVLVDTFLHWSYFGQGIILAMIQIGGIGLVTFVSFFNFALGRKLGLRRMQLASESISGTNSFSDIRSLLRSIISIALAVEAIGAVLLMFAFVPRFGASGIFTSVFMSVSAFCNAGFDVLGRTGAYVSLTGYANNPYVLTVIMLLIICGGLGFVVWHDLIEYRKTKHLVLHTKIVLVCTAFLIVGGALLIGIVEWNNPATLGGLSYPSRVINAVFQSVTCRTAGFNTINLAECDALTKTFMIILMFIGASSGSTGGGVKVTTIAVLIMTIVCVLRSKTETIIIGRRVSQSVVYRAITLVTLSVVLIFTASLVVYYTTCQPAGLKGVDAAFEATSAFSTTGVSTGATAHTNLLAQLVLIAIMFLGRVGPISVVLSLTDSMETAPKNEVIPEGKIIVG